MEQKPPAPPEPPRAPANAPETYHPHSGPRKKRAWIWIVLLLAFAAIFVAVLRYKPAPAAAAAGGGRGGGGRGSLPVTLNTATASAGQIGVYLDAIGTVTATYTASITSQASGRVVAVHYREGENVRRGSPLIDIDPRPYQAALDTAQGVLQRDTAVLAQAKMDLQRYREAWARNAIAKQMLDDQEKLVDQDEGLVQSDKGTVETDQVQLSYCHITSPIVGRAGLRLVDPGNVVAANGTTPLVVLAQVQPITVIFTIPEDSLPQVEKSMKSSGGRHAKKAALPVLAFDRAVQKQLAQGRLETIDNQIDTTTGTVKLRAIFDNKDNALFPNQFVNTRLLVNTLYKQVLLPTSAVQRNGEQSFVYLIQDGKAQIKNIKTGAVDGSYTAVQGLNPGDIVADSSFEKLQNGSKVKIAKGKIGETQDSETGAP
jgi:multidrug efflux system membrane fusion protein